MACRPSVRLARSYVIHPDGKADYYFFKELLSQVTDEARGDKLIWQNQVILEQVTEPFHKILFSATVSEILIASISLAEPM